MAYCPEDGTQLECVNPGAGFNCYDCPSCQTHWVYNADDGTYTAYMPGQTCSNCQDDPDDGPDDDQGNPPPITREEARERFRRAVLECARPLETNEPEA